jgi:hypothetical protein
MPLEAPLPPFRAPTCVAPVLHTRRGFLRAGGLALGGLTLADVLRARAAAAPSRRPKAAIMVHLSGGPSHLDMFDMKPQAPVEYRGEFSPIHTNVPGIDICELMPMQTRIADKFAILRGAQLANLHTGNAFYSGYAWQESPRASVPGEARRPALGSVVSRIRGASLGSTPYVSLQNPADWERAYYLGREHEPFRVGGSSPPEALQNMSRPAGVSAERMSSRAALQRSFDDFRRTVDLDGSARAMDAFQARALEIVASSQVRDAFDLDRESPETRARYGEGMDAQGQNPWQFLLQARRLIEAGVSVVTACMYGWDTHSHNFSTLRKLVPALDRAVHALVTDLDERGMLDDVVILIGGEFGRTPRIGDQTPDGRSHWPEAGFLWLAGGGLRTGQVIGATDDRGERVIGNPIQIQNVLATMYGVLGIDPGMTFPDHNGRPQYVLENRDVIPGLI